MTIDRETVNPQCIGDGRDICRLIDDTSTRFRRGSAVARPVMTYQTDSAATRVANLLLE